MTTTLSPRGLQQNVGSALATLFLDARAVLKAFALSLYALVFSMFQHFKILWTVIVFLAVTMMDKIFTRKTTANHFLCHKPMFKNVATSSGIRMARHLDEHIAFFAKNSTASPPTIRCAGFSSQGDVFRRMFPPTILMPSHEPPCAPSLQHRRREFGVLNNFTTTASTGG